MSTNRHSAEQVINKLRQAGRRGVVAGPRRRKAESLRSGASRCGSSGSRGS